MSAIQSSDGLVGGPWAHDITEVFKSTKLAETCQETLNLLSFNVSDAREVLRYTLDNPWDFSFFYDRPIFTLENGLSFPVHRLLLENSLSELLFWTVRKCYPEKSRTFQIFFGRAFEFYGQDVLQASCEVSPLPYEFIPEQQYRTRDGEHRTPDAMIRLGDKLLVVEIKIQRLHFKKSVVEGDVKQIEADRKKMTVAPIVQAYDEVKRLLDGLNPNIDLSGVKEIHFVAINYDLYPTFSILIQDTERDWGNLSGITLQTYFYHGSVEDLEAIAYLLERPRPIFRMLLHKHANFRQFDFRNFFYTQKVRIKQPVYLNDRLEQLADSMKFQLFDNVEAK